MAHFAQLDENNKVAKVIVINNNELLDENQSESETKGIEFCKSLFGQNTVWKQTSFNNKFRKNFAGVGYSYNEQKDCFIPPKPFDSWILNEQTCLWDAPQPMPINEKVYYWDEETISWKEQP